MDADRERTLVAQIQGAVEELLDNGWDADAVNGSFTEVVQEAVERWKADNDDS